MKLYESELNMLPGFLQNMNSRNDVQDLSKPKRKKRSSERVAIPRLVEVNDDGDQNNENVITKRVVTLDCDLGTAKCLKITCELYNIQANYTAVIEVRSRLWNSTLADDYSFDYVD